MIRSDWPGGLMPRLGVLFLVAALAACATSPTGRSQFLLISPEAAIVQSRQAWLDTVRRFERDDRLLHDPVLADRIGVITGRLVTVAEARFPHTRDWDWSVALIDDPETVNAWCMAGGRMAVYSGLVKQLRLTDDELAQIMGHEMSHAIANHTAEKMSIAIAQSVGVAAVAVASEDRETAETAQLAAQLAIALPNSRTAETEADRIGIELAARAGYEPDAAVSLWRKMERHGGARPPAFLSTHPSPANRRQTLAALGQTVRPLLPPAQPLPKAVNVVP